jgi:hypothetical protein
MGEKSASTADGSTVYVVYNAFTTPYQTNTSSPRNLVGVVKRGTVNSGVTGAWSTLNRGATGDARASSANSQVAEFLGDYVSRLCRGIVRHIYVRRSKVRKHGSHGRLQKRQLCLQELVSGATASVLPWPDFALGDHPAPRAFPRFKAVAYPSGLSRGRACDSRLPRLRLSKP